MKLYAWNKFSEGAKLLAQRLGVKRLRTEGNAITFNGPLLNWGSGNIKRDVRCNKIINNPIAVRRASNKLQSFEAMNGHVSIPDYTTDKEIAQEWIEGGSTVVCRTILNGHAGAGIVLAETVDQLVDAPLFVKYVPKNQEYRVHVMNSTMIHKQRKARSREVADENVNWKIRNHENGFIFQINDFEIPNDCVAQAIAAVTSLGLDFGAVDVIYNERQQKAYVLEVNTAPGLAGTTLDKYAEAILQYY